MTLIPDALFDPLFPQKGREAVEYAIDKEAIAKAKCYGFRGHLISTRHGYNGLFKDYQGAGKICEGKYKFSGKPDSVGFKTKISPHFRR